MKTAILVLSSFIACYIYAQKPELAIPYSITHISKCVLNPEEGRMYVSFSPEPGIVTTEDFSNYVETYDLSTKRRLSRDVYGRMFCFSPDGKFGIYRKTHFTNKIINFTYYKVDLRTKTKVDSLVTDQYAEYSVFFASPNKILLFPDIGFPESEEGKKCIITEYDFTTKRLRKVFEIDEKIKALLGKQTIEKRFYPVFDAYANTMQLINRTNRKALHLELDHYQYQVIDNFRDNQLCFHSGQWFSLKKQKGQLEIKNETKGELLGSIAVGDDDIVFDIINSGKFYIQTTSEQNQNEGEIAIYDLSTCNKIIQYTYTENYPRGFSDFHYSVQDTQLFAQTTGFGIDILHKKGVDKLYGSNPLIWNNTELIKIMHSLNPAVFTHGASISNTFDKLSLYAVNSNQPKREYTLSGLDPQSKMNTFKQRLFTISTGDTIRIIRTSKTPFDPTLQFDFSTNQSERFFPILGLRKSDDCPGIFSIEKNNATAPCMLIDPIIQFSRHEITDNSWWILNYQNRILFSGDYGKTGGYTLYKEFTLGDCKQSRTFTLHPREKIIDYLNTDSLLLYSSDSGLFTWNLETNKRNYYQYDKKVHFDWLGMKLSLGKRYLVARGSEKEHIIYSVPDVKKIATRYHYEPPTTFVSDDVFFTKHMTHLNFYHLNHDSVWFTIYPLNDTDWVITTPSGLFDASPGAMQLMYYVVNREVIELNQLKERYYEPGLLNKLLGYSSEPLRKVIDFNEVKLYPKIDHQLDKNQLKVKLINRGGGIGKTSILINGKEIASDIRGKGVNPMADSVSITFPIANHPYLVNGHNTIEVKAHNADGYLVSKGVKTSYMHNKPSSENLPSLYCVSIGTSDYYGNQIDLKFAAKDAKDFHQAVLLGAKNLFGSSKTFSYLITTDSASKYKPSKSQIKSVFKTISEKAKSNDIILVYMSGHGINWGGQDGDFYYLTKDAYSSSADAYNDPSIRNSVAISSTEITEWIKEVPALKQVLIIDACASGKTVDNLIAKREISSSTLRALDRLKDRTGMHIITGCAADAVSYEASAYGQGLLTYSLLEGLKGAALREGRFADINLLFQYARERVPHLAGGIGGIQEPKIFAPNGSQSFDVAQLNEPEKMAIKLEQPKPIFVRSQFINSDELEDNLHIGRAMDEWLQNTTASSYKSKLVFIDATEFPTAYKINGSYVVKDGEIVLRLKIKSSKQEIKKEISGKEISIILAQLTNELDKLVP